MSHIGSGRLQYDSDNSLAIRPSRNIPILYECHIISNVATDETQSSETNNESVCIMPVYYSNSIVNAQRCF